MLSAAAAVVTTSWWTRDRLLERYPLPPDQVHVAEPGVDPAGLAPGTGRGGELLCVAAVTAAQGPRRAARRAGRRRRPAVALRLRRHAGPRPGVRRAAAAPGRSGRDRPTGSASRARGPATTSTARTPPPTCWCSPRGPRPTAWWSPRPGARAAGDRDGGRWAAGGAGPAPATAAGPACWCRPGTRALAAALRRWLDRRRTCARRLRAGGRPRQPPLRDRCPAWASSGPGSHRPHDDLARGGCSRTCHGRRALAAVRCRPRSRAGSLAPGRPRSCVARSCGGWAPARSSTAAGGRRLVAGRRGRHRGA